MVKAQKQRKVAKKDKSKIKKGIAKGLIILGIAILLLIISFIFDSQVIFLINSLKTPCLNSFFSWLIFLEKDIIFYPLIIIVTLLLLFLTKRKIKILPYILSLIVVIIVTFVLKTIIARPRPNFSSNDSFPSGHTSFLFTSLPYFSGIRILQIIWIIISCLLVLARIWFNFHYLSDIIAGIIVGYCIPAIINIFFKKKTKP